MKAAIISIGDELLIGQTVNTNAAWLGKELSLRGIPIQTSWAIADEPEEICSALDQLLFKVQLIILTGGLGPTKDDLTKHTLTKYFDTELEMHADVLERIEQFFQRRNRPMLEVNRQQAALPKACRVLHNYHGTACGMWFEKQGCVVISLPGVPYEMKGIMTDEVFPILADKFSLSEIYHQTLMTQGIGESFIADRFSDWETKVRERGFGLAYLPSPGLVKLRITSRRGSADKEEIHHLLEEVLHAMPNHAYSIGEKSIFEFVGEILLKQNKKLGCVESCTGGHLSEQIVSVPGSSRYFEGGVIAYSYDQKTNLLGVNADDLVKYGAVSEPVIKQMAENGRLRMGLDVCIATSGIAGPDGGTAEKPVGSVWVAVSTEKETITRLFHFGDNRERNIHMTALSAMNMTRCVLQGLSFEKK